MDNVNKKTIETGNEEDRINNDNAFSIKNDQMCFTCDKMMILTYRCLAS